MDPDLGQLLPPYWERYAEGCERAGRRAHPDVWRVARSILVTESDSEADDYMAAPESALAFYFKFMHYSFSNARKALFMLKSDPNVPDESFTPEAARRGVVIAGGPRRVLDQLVALRDEIGPFGTLLMTGHDWDQPKLWRRDGAARHRRDAEAIPARALTAFADAGRC